MLYRPWAALLAAVTCFALAEQSPAQATADELAEVNVLDLESLLSDVQSGRAADRYRARAFNPFSVRPSVRPSFRQGFLPLTRGRLERLGTDAATLTPAGETPATERTATTDSATAEFVPPALLENGGTVRGGYRPPIRSPFRPPPRPPFVP